MQLRDVQPGTVVMWNGRRYTVQPTQEGMPVNDIELVCENGQRVIVPCQAQVQDRLSALTGYGLYLLAVTSLQESGAIGEIVAWEALTDEQRAWFDEWVIRLQDNAARMREITVKRAVLEMAHWRTQRLIEGFSA